MSLTSVIVCIVIALIIAAIVTGVMKGALKSVRFNDGAGNYRKEGSFNITERNEVFLYKIVNKTPRPKPQNNK